MEPSLPGQSEYRYTSRYTRIFLPYLYAYELDDNVADSKRERHRVALTFRNMTDAMLRRRLDEAEYEQHQARVGRLSSLSSRARVVDRIGREIETRKLWRLLQRRSPDLWNPPGYKRY